MNFQEIIETWKDKKILIIGEALLDKYIYGVANKISPDAPVPNIKIEKTDIFLGGIGLVTKFIKSLGGTPIPCTAVGNDFEGSYFLQELHNLNIDSSHVISAKGIKTPQITRIKAMDQHVLRLETNYEKEIPSQTSESICNSACSISDSVDAILFLNYGLGGLFNEQFITTLLTRLKTVYNKVPIIARPNFDNYYLYEDVDLIKMTLFKALQTSSIECCTETSISIVGKKIITNTRAKNVFFNDIESTSYLFSKNSERIEKIEIKLKNPIRSYIAVGSTIMAVLGLACAAKASPMEAVNLALHAALYSASVPPIEFFNSETLLFHLNSLQ